MSTERDADWDEGERETLAGLERQIDTMRLRHRGDPALDILYAARHDVLPGEWQAQVEAHLATSAWSRTLIGGVIAPARSAVSDDPLDADTHARLLARITREVGGAPPVPTRKWPQARPVWIVSASAAAILMAVVLQTSRGTAPATSAIARGAAGSEATPGPGDTPGLKPRGHDGGGPDGGGSRGTVSDEQMAQATPPFVLPFDKPEVRLSAAALVWRGPDASASSDGQRYLADLKPALDAYRAGDYARADAAFAALRLRYPAAIEVLFYQGASRLLADDVTGALEPLGEAARHADQAFAADVALLLAVAEQRTGHTASARARLQQGCTPGRAQTVRVCAALTALDAALPAASSAK